MFVSLQGHSGGTTMFQLIGQNEGHGAKEERYPLYVVQAF